VNLKFQCTNDSRITNSNYDTTGLEIERVVKHYFVSQKAPPENFAGGPGWKCLAVLWVVHKLGVVAGWGIHFFGPRAKAAVEGLQRRRNRQA
jgi:hypothetical protein